jgi:sulfoxide reductase catalytic subunit YedY
MLIKRRRGWEIAERLATPEAVFLDRRSILAGMAALGTTIALPRIARAGETDPTADLYPAKRNEAFKLDRDLTPEAFNLRYNNFYEFGSHKEIYEAAQALKTRPWTVAITGMVEQPREIAIDDLIRKMPLEERLYRHRCVEAWSMTVPWTGFAMKDLVALAQPLSSAKYVRMETFMDPAVASGQTQSWYPWPYVEGMTLAEATNELAFVVTGAYGKPLAKQMGAPLRLHLPWKYGFKSIKSIVSFAFTDTRPIGYWETVQGSEYGFWANVNPEVPHPRWSQASERILHTGERVPTLLYNGYAEWVADLYRGLEGERLYM